MSPGRIFALLAALGALALAAVLCAFQVSEGEVALVLRFGSPVRTIEQAGLHWKLPAPIDAVVRVDRRVHVLDPGPDEYLTGDKKNVVVDTFVAWQVADPLRFYQSVSDRAGAEARLAEVLGSVVGDVLSSREFDAMVAVGEREGLREVSRAITQATAERAGPSFGVRIVAARIKRLDFPGQNKRAVFSRMEAERAAIAGEIRSQGVEEYDKVKAEADREAARLMAEADRQATELLGAAEAEATRVYGEALAKDPELYAFLRSLEVLETVLDGDLLILGSDHELLRALQSGAPEGPPPPRAPTDGGD